MMPQGVVFRLLPEDGLDYPPGQLSTGNFKRVGVVGFKPRGCPPPAG